MLDDVKTLSLGDGSYLRQWEQDLGTLHHTGCTLLVEERHQGLASLKVHDGLVGLELGVGTEGVGSGLHGFLVFRGVGPQGVLHAVAQLTEYVLRDIGGTLGDEIDAHTLGANQSDHLLYLVEQDFAGVVEQHMSLVEEEDELWQGQVAHFGQFRIQVVEQP